MLSLRTNQEIEISSEIQKIVEAYKKLHRDKIDFIDEELDVLHDQKPITFLKPLLIYEFYKKNTDMLKKLFTEYSTTYFPVDTFSWSNDDDKALHMAVRTSSALAKYLIEALHADRNVLNK